MAISSDPSVLAAASRCFDTCIPPGDQAAVKTYLLAQIAGVTDPSMVANNARCFSSCIPSGAQVDVQAYLAAVLEGGSLDPSTLLNNATCFRSCVPPGASTSVANYVLASQAGGSTDAATLANLARCFSSCIPPGMQLAAQTYLLGVKAGITDPALALTNARCFRCFDGSDPTVGDAMITRWVVGGFVSPGGGGGGGGGSISTPTNFVYASNFAFTFVVAGWDAAPAGVTATELWTSSDNITFALAQTINVPTTTANVAIPAIGSTTYAKIRWINATTQSPFTSVLQFTRTDWETRAFANSGVAILAGSKAIQNNFYSDLANKGLLSVMITANMFDKQSGKIGHAKTPVVNSGGSDPWTTFVLIDANVTPNGVLSSAGGYMRPGVLGTTFPSDTNAGFSLYSFTGISGVGLWDMAYGNGTGTIACAMKINDGGNLTCKMWNDTSQIVVPTQGAGYYSGNRTGATDFNVYYGKSTTPHTNIGSSALASGTRQAQQIDAFAVNVYDVPVDTAFSNKTLSFMAFHQGLTSAQSALLFAAVQNSLVFSGAGFV